MDNVYVSNLYVQNILPRANTNRENCRGNWCRLLSSLKLTGAYYVKIKMRASSDINYQRLQFK